MRAAHRSDRGGMARGGQPVVNGGADLAPFDGRLAGSMMPGDQQQDAITARDRLFQTEVDRRPGAVQVQSVKVEHTVGISPPGGQLPVPAAIEGLVGDRHGFGLRLSRRTRVRRWPWRDCPGKRTWNRSDRDGLSRQRADRRRDPRPKLGFLRAEGAHGRPRPSAPGSGPGRSRTCRRRSPPLPRPIPRRYRTDWDP